MTSTRSLWERGGGYMSSPLEGGMGALRASIYIFF